MLDKCRVVVALAPKVGVAEVAAAVAAAQDGSTDSFSLLNQKNVWQCRSRRTGFPKARNCASEARGPATHDNDIVRFPESKRFTLLGSLPFALCVLLFAHASHNT